ncbi:hypothetical protein GW17_00036813 [Ensete ventricosum]|nr:hypothetical protein GW17_00036813 [Ensete ventricosum]
MGIGGLSNVIGMGGVRGISSPISGLGNISPHQMNLASASNFSPGPRSSSLSHAQAAAAAMATKLRMAQQSRGSYGQSGIAVYCSTGSLYAVNSLDPLGRNNDACSIGGGGGNRRLAEAGADIGPLRLLDPSRQEFLPCLGALRRLRRLGGASGVGPMTAPPCRLWYYAIEQAPFLQSFDVFSTVCFPLFSWMNTRAS